MTVVTRNMVSGKQAGMVVFFFNPHPRICSLILQRRGRGRWGGGRTSVGASRMHPDWGSKLQPRYVP